MPETNTIDMAANVSAAYSALFNNLGKLALLVVGWAVLGVAIFYGVQIAAFSALQRWPEISSWDDNAFVLVAMIPLALVFALGTSSVVVAWHRLVISGEFTSSPFPIGIGAMLRYIGCVILVFGIALAPMALLLFGYAALHAQAPAGKGGGLWFGLSAIALAVFASVVSLLLCLLFPAAAVGDRTMTLARSWRLTRGNVWLLFWGSFACAFPFSVVGRLLDKAMDAEQVWDGAGAVIAIIAGTVEILAYANLAGFVSLAYMQLTDSGSALDRPPASHFK